MPPKPTTVETRLSLIEQRQENHGEILESVAESLKQLVKIEASTASMAQSIEDVKADMQEVRLALHGSQDSKGVFTRLGEIETKQDHHKKLWLYVGGAVGGGIMWGLGQVFYSIWDAAVK